MKVNFFGDVYLTDKFVVSESLDNILKISDRNIVNFEAPIICDDTPSREKVGAVLKHKLDSLESLKILRVTDVCTANNHYFDFGLHAALESNDILKKSNFVVHGECDHVCQKILSANNDIKLAVFNVAESEYGVKFSSTPGFMSVTDPALYPKIFEAISENYKVIMVVHAGFENKLSPLRSWSEVYKNFIDLGVTAVIAHHPHVPQRYESYKNGIIFYSLGNFLFQGSGGSEFNSIGQFVSFDFTADEFSYDVNYTKYENNTIELYAEANVFDEFLNVKVEKFYHVTDKDYKSYCRLDYKRFIGSIINKTFLKNLPYFKMRSKRQYDFHLHNLRFETHRFAQLEYIEDKLK